MGIRAVLRTIRGSNAATEARCAQLAREAAWQREVGVVTALVADKVLDRRPFGTHLSWLERRACRNGAHLYVETAQLVTDSVLGDNALFPAAGYNLLWALE